MKKMTLLTLFLSSFVLLSCSDQEQPLEEELVSVAAKTAKEKEYDYLYGNLIYYASAEAEIKRLESQKTKLVAERENGNKEAIQQIENIQIEIEKLTRFNDYLMITKPPKRPKGPVPPQPCLDTANCDPIQKLTANTAIVLGDELIVINVIIKDRKNGRVKMDFQPVEDSFGQSSLFIKSDFKGEGVMYTTLKIKSVGEITIPTPISRY